MPIPNSPLTSESSLAVVSSAVLFALLDTLLAKGVLDKSEIQNILKTAKGCVSARTRSFCGPEAAELMNNLCKHFGASAPAKGADDVDPGESREVASHLSN